MRAIKRKFALPDNLIQLSNKDWSKELEQLNGTWNLGEKVMFITGETDCGKTDLAICFSLKVCPDNTYLICHTNTLRTTIADIPMLGYIQIPEDWSLSEDVYEKQRCDEKLRILQHYYPGALFIVDGVDARMIRTEPEYEKLMSLNARFIFTSRNRCPGESIHLSKKTGCTQVILNKLNHLTSEERKVLCCAALLSDFGLPMVRFRQCLSDKGKDAINSLLAKKLLALRLESTIAIRPDIRELYLRNLQPTDAACADFLDQLAFFTVPKTCYSPEGYRQVACCFTNASKLLRDETGLFAQHAAHMFRDSGDYIPSFSLLDKRLARQRALRPECHLDLALALCEAGSANWLQAASSQDGTRRHLLIEQAATRIQEGVTLYEQNLVPSHPDLTEARMAFATVLQKQDWCFANDYAQKTLDTQVAMLPDDDPALCSTYLGYAMLHYHWSERKLRREHAKKALKVMERLDYLHKDMALAYGILSDCSETIEQRLGYAFSSLDIYRVQTPWAQHHIYKCLIKIAELYKLLGRYGLQKEHLQQATGLLESILPPNHPKLVKLYEDIKNIEEDHND